MHVLNYLLLLLLLLSASSVNKPPHYCQSVYYRGEAAFNHIQNKINGLIQEIPAHIEQVRQLLYTKTRQRCASVNWLKTNTFAGWIF